MLCPVCYSPDWHSIEKNKDGVNVRVQCNKCGWTYGTRFRSESVEYRLADGYSHGHIMVEVKSHA